MRRTELRRAAPVFAALGDPTRLRLVSRLCEDGPSSIARLTEGTGVTRQAVTKHLQILSTAGLVRSSWRGRENVWVFEPDALADAQRQLAAVVRQWDDLLVRLKAHVESAPSRKPRG